MDELIDELIEQPDEQPEEQLDEHYLNPICAITFQISQNGEVDLLASWDNEARPIDLFAELLQNITSAQLNSLIVKSLLEIARTQPTSTDFIMSMLNKWKEMVTKVIEEPLISPAQVFGLTKPR